MPIRGFEASQSEIVSVLERLQNARYEVTHFDDDIVIAKAQRSWQENKDAESALLLVKAGFFLDGYGSNFIKEAITQNGNDFLQLPELGFEGVVAEAVKLWA